MFFGKSSWRKLLANGLLALALVLSHTLPTLSSNQPSQMAHAQMDDGHCHDSQSDQKSVTPHLGAACQACPGMAIFLPEPLRQPIRIAVSSFDPPEPRLAQGISLSLDTPPPKSLTVV